MADFCLDGLNPLCWIGVILGGGCGSYHYSSSSSETEINGRSYAMGSFDYVEDINYGYAQLTDACSSSDYTNGDFGNLFRMICSGSGYNGYRMTNVSDNETGCFLEFVCE